MSRGVAVVVTGVGVAAGLDARTGDILWLFRYDRQRPPERERLSEETRNQVPVRSRWAREPPRIVADRVYLAPPDSNDLYGCFLRGRRIPAGEPGAGGFYLESWDPLHRAEGHRNCVLEYLAGFRSGRVFCVGSPDRNFHAYESVLSLDVSVVSVLQGQGGALAYGRLPLTHLRRSDAAPMPPQLFGRPALAGDVLLVPTRRVLYRFEAGGEPAVKKTGPDPREVAILPPFAPQTGEPPKPGSEPAPLFGNLVSAGGVLYAVTFDRVLAYGERPATEPSPGKEKAPEKKG